MKSVLMMSLANIRKRKIQSALMGITLFMAALLLATAIGMLQGMEDPVDRMFERQKGSHITMMMPTQSHQRDEIVSWWASQKGVEGVVQFPYYMAEDDFKHNGKKQSMGGIMLTEHPAQPLKQDQLHIVEGPFRDSPGKGEVWVPTGYAYSWGIQVGDTLEVPVDGVYKSFTVSAIVVDPQFSPGMMNPVRAWVTAGFFAISGKVGEELGSLIGVRLFDNLEYNKLWQDFEAYLEAPYMGFVFEYQFIKNIYSMVQNMLAIIMLAFAGMIIVVSMLVISFTITNGVMADYKTIGILKAQGFSARHVKWIYSLQYLFLAVIAAPVGIVASRYVAGMVLLQMSKT